MTGENNKARPSQSSATNPSRSAENLAVTNPLPERGPARSCEVVEMDVFETDLRRVVVAAGIWEELTDEDRAALGRIRVEVTAVFDHYNKTIRSLDFRWKRQAHRRLPNEQF